jgi:ribosome-binding factor A
VRIRPERVAHLMRREVAEILGTLRDPRLTHWVSVTDVEVTPDLSMARVYVSILPEGREREQSLEALAHASGFVRRALAPRLGLREVPEIRFLLDRSIESGARVDELLRKIERGEPIEDEREPGREGEPIEHEEEPAREHEPIEDEEEPGREGEP